jgi:hypothetical protein
MKNEKQTPNENHVHLQRVNDYLGSLQRNQLDGTTIPLKSHFPLDIDPELIQHLKQSLVETHIIAES